VHMAYSLRYWEDALITCLHTENLVGGLGLTHVRPGEPPLHGFTSPLSVLVPLIGDLVRVGFGVDFIKIVSLPAAALTVLYVLAIGLHPRVRLPGPLIGLVMGYVALEHSQILWAASGMETQFVVLTFVMSLYYAIAWQPLPLGISLGLCMLARPDFAFWTIIVGIYGLFRAPRQLLLRVVPVALALYLPWVIFTFLYYGSPVPHTIIAKGLGYPKFIDQVGLMTWRKIFDYSWMRAAAQFQSMLGPSYCGHGATVNVFFSSGYLSPVGIFISVFVVIGMIVIVLGRQWPLWPLVGFALVYLVYYVYAVPIIFGWYKMPLLAALVFLGARGVAGATAWLRDRPRAILQTALAVAYVGLFVAVLPITFATDRQVQRHVEDALRKEAGLYLRDRMQPDEAVGGEPLGYMGYYSRGNVYDWPGLDSRAVVAWSRANPGKRSLENMLRDLRPEYLFLRDVEVLYSFKDTSWIRRDYHPVKAFLIDPEAAKKMRWIETNIDVQYRLYKKSRQDDAQPYDDGLWPCAPPVNITATPILNRYGLAFARQRRHREAAAHFERVIELAPTDRQAHENLAVVYLRDGQRDRARNVVEKLRDRWGEVDPRLLRAMEGQEQ
ncbi:MAG TPA: tetratricopeptide repeat protein, partial [Candidatus Hydrogenedentes bacterium]|nr:tetratricopeptide repeat protein [Candidatus Hydrogenedentota bacterium]